MDKTDYNNNALIGYTGFVGSNILKHNRNFQYFYNSQNIQEIRGKSFDLVVSCGTPSAVWIANKEPEKDWEIISSLLENLKYVKAKKFVLISTIYSYQNPVNVDEDTPTNPDLLNPYGKNRLLMEEFVKSRFDTTIIRLPNLIGINLKKNVVYDLLNNNQVEKIHADSIYQYYNLEYLWKDISFALKNNIGLLNMASEPLSVREIAKHSFGIEFNNKPVTGAGPVNCDFHSKYSKLWSSNRGRNDGKNTNYLYDKKSVLSDLKKFVDNYRDHKLKLAVSNIAWSSQDEESVQRMLLENSVHAIEISPDRLMNEKHEFDETKMQKYKNFWSQKGMEFVSFQGVLFSKENLKIFESEQNRRETLDYLKKIISVAEKLDAKVVMFGSPRNRKRNGLSLEEADAIAVQFFRELAAYAFAKGITFCIEHNPKEYNSDYVLTATDAFELAKKVNHPGFGINVDTGALLMTNDTAETILKLGSLIKHYHISQPNLTPVGDIDDEVQEHHESFFNALQKIKYDGWVSIEMRQSGTGSAGNIENLAKAIEKVRNICTALK